MPGSGHSFKEQIFDVAMSRIVVVGTTGSGKTTLAAELAARLGVPHIEMDALHWDPNWTAASAPILRERASNALAGNAWVLDGNYPQVRDIAWGRADTIVWLDYPLGLILRRLVPRTATRVVRGTKLFNGNRESMRTAFSRDSIVLWALGTFRQRRREYSELFAEPEYRHLRKIHLRSPAETEVWLANCVPFQCEPTQSNSLEPNPDTEP